MKKFFLYKKMNSYSNYKIEMISSKYITQEIFDNLHKKRALQIIKYNRKIQIKLEKILMIIKNFLKFIHQLK